MPFLTSLPVKTFFANKAPSNSASNQRLPVDLSVRLATKLNDSRFITELLKIKKKSILIQLESSLCK